MKATVIRPDGNITKCETCADLRAALGRELHLLAAPADHLFLCKISNIDVERTASEAGLICWQQHNGDWIIEEPVFTSTAVKRDLKFDHISCFDGRMMTARSRPLCVDGSEIRPADNPVGVILGWKWLQIEHRMSLDDAMQLHAVLSDAITR